MQKLKTLIRIVENNDWVVFCILGSIFVFIIILSILNRNVNIKDFLTREVDTRNLTLTWLLVTLVRSVIISALLSKFVTSIPNYVSELEFYGYQLNDFGFALLVFLIFEFSRNLLSIVFYTCTSNNKNIKQLTLLASKYYFIETIFFIAITFAVYFYSFNNLNLWYFITIIVFTSFILKNLIYIFNKKPVLPQKWYYKFLYICTLQIIPFLVVWKMLFY